MKSMVRLVSGVASRSPSGIEFHKDPERQTRVLHTGMLLEIWLSVRFEASK
jgi:hypothetical protein